MSLAGKQMEVEIILLSKISHKQGYNHHIFSLICVNYNLKKTN
jgi:hypothetical protein